MLLDDCMLLYGRKLLAINHPLDISFILFHSFAPFSSLKRSQSIHAINVYSLHAITTLFNIQKKHDIDVISSEAWSVMSLTLTRTFILWANISLCSYPLRSPSHDGSEINSTAADGYIYTHIHEYTYWHVLPLLTLWLLLACFYVLVEVLVEIWLPSIHYFAFTSYLAD